LIRVTISCRVEETMATTTHAQSVRTTEREGGLKRVISKRMLVIFVVGDILGTGIYALVGEVAGEVGGAVWTSFALAFALAFITAFAYAELVTKYPHAAGAALYAHKAFKLPFVTFLVAFAVMASGIASASAAARAFGGDYLSTFVELPVVLVALAFVLVLAVINFGGISESVKLNLGLTLIEVSGLLLIIFIGFVALSNGDADTGRAMEFKEGSSVPLAIMGGAALAFYALIGFEDSVNVAEETHDPRRAFPRALFGGLAIAAVIYLAVTFIASAVVPTGSLADSSAPLLEVVRRGSLDISPRLFSVIALVAITNTALINMIMASRLTYGMGRQKVVPEVFARVHPQRQTPWVGIIFTTLIAIALVTTGEVETLADTTVVLLLAVFILVNISVLILRRDRVDHDHFHAPSALPVIGAIVCVALMTQQEAAIFLRAGILLLIGVILYGINYLFTGRAGKLDAHELTK
jgi:basic amino acid/polyamine antiporter, APA family